MIAPHFRRLGTDIANKIQYSGWCREVQSDVTKKRKQSDVQRNTVIHSSVCHSMYFAVYFSRVKLKTRDSIVTRNSKT